MAGLRETWVSGMGLLSLLCHFMPTAWISGRPSRCPAPAVSHSAARVPRLSLGCLGSLPLTRLPGFLTSRSAALTSRSHSPLRSHPPAHRPDVIPSGCRDTAKSYRCHQPVRVPVATLTVTSFSNFRFSVICLTSPKAMKGRYLCVPPCKERWDKPGSSTRHMQSCPHWRAREKKALKLRRKAALQPGKKQKQTVGSEVRHIFYFSNNSST